MLRGIDPVSSSDVLHALRAMGHGDKIARVGMNFPAEALGSKCTHIDEVDPKAMPEDVMDLGIEGLGIQRPTVGASE